ncbi:MAG: PEP-utilizing enzyme [Candidatus Hodarchaeales archaeon]
MKQKRRKEAKVILKGWAANQISHSEGFAFIARTPSAARDRIATNHEKKSLILVCPRLDWSWSDIANDVAGVITDHGTRVSRGSEVSGIVQVPAVLGTKIATKNIQDGDYIKINCEGNQAIARIYRKKP